MTADKVERHPPAPDRHTRADRTVGTRVVEPADRPTIFGDLRIRGRRRQLAAWGPRYGRRTSALRAVHASVSLPATPRQTGK
jgi:hypothetical protein